MKHSIAVLLASLAVTSVSAADIVQVKPWELHSSFWMSLHQTLIADAMREAPRPLPDLSTEEKNAWDQAVTAYRTAGGRGDMTFADPMIFTTDGLARVDDEGQGTPGDVPLKGALTQAASIYRQHWWTADDRSNRFFIAVAAALLREGGDTLVRAHETIYRTKWPERIRVYITPWGGPFGGYTINQPAGPITTMASREEGYQGMRALEMLLHESSHAVVNPNNGTVAAAIRSASRQRGIPIPPSLWHAILFTTSGELARRFLADHGVTKFVPSSDELFARAWPQFRDPIVKNWIPYLEGHGTLEEAIDKVVAAIQK
jgi:hypothetical protein